MLPARRSPQGWVLRARGSLRGPVLWPGGARGAGGRRVCCHPLAHPGGAGPVGGWVGGCPGAWGRCSAGGGRGVGPGRAAGLPLLRSRLRLLPPPRLRRSGRPRGSAPATPLPPPPWGARRRGLPAAGAEPGAAARYRIPNTPPPPPPGTGHPPGGDGAGVGWGGFISPSGAWGRGWREQAQPWATGLEPGGTSGVPPPPRPPNFPPSPPSREGGQVLLLGAAFLPWGPGCLLGLGALAPEPWRGGGGGGGEALFCPRNTPTPQGGHEVPETPASKVYPQPALRFRPLENRWITSFEAQHPPRSVLPALVPLQSRFLFKRGFSLPPAAWKPAPQETDPDGEPTAAVCQLCPLRLECPKVSFGVCVPWLPPLHPQKPSREQALKWGAVGWLPAGG